MEEINSSTYSYYENLKWCNRKGVLCGFADSNGFCQVTACNISGKNGVLATFAVGDNDMLRKIIELEEKISLLEQELQKLKMLVK